jgi:hypothetical protein
VNFSKEQKDYIIHALEHCEVLTGGRSSGKTLELIKQQDKEIKRLHSIIKEVREYIDTLEKQHAYKFVEVDNHTEMRIDENEYLVWCKYNKLLKILDKGE